MKHVILYGPPAVGKLSVGTELAKLTGYPLVHNHLTNNLVLRIFPYGHPEFSKLAISLRNEIFEAAARSETKGIISTCVYGRGLDDKTVKDWIRRIKRHKGETLFVRLHCDEKTLVKRIGLPSRRANKKMIEKKLLNLWLKRKNIQSPIDYVDSLDINTDLLKPRQAALRIKRHYRL